MSQVLWSQRFGESFGKNWNLGSLLGIDNEKKYSRFFGIDTSFRPFIDASSPKIDLFGAVSGQASGSIGIANSRDKSKPATLKAGVQVDAGYSLGGVNWNLPLFVDTKLQINNSNRLQLTLDYDKRGAFFDYNAPYLYLDVTGKLQSNAALYLSGKADYEYIDVWKSLWSWEKKVNRESVGFDEKINLSANFNHQFVDFDTRQSVQKVDWLFGKKEYQLGGSGKKQEPLRINDFLRLGFNLPNFNNVEFSPTTLSGLLNTNGLNLDKNSWVYSLKDEFEIFKFTFDLDAFIAPKLPIPTTLTGGDGYKLFGQEFGYEYNIALFDADLNISLNLGYQVDLGITNLLPKIQIEASGGAWVDYNLQSFDFVTGDPNTPQGQQTNVATVQALAALDRDNDKQLEFRLNFNPSAFVNAKAYFRPVVNVATGIGEYSFKLKPFKSFGGENQYLLDTPDLNLRGEEFSLFSASFRKTLSELGVLPDTLRTKNFSISIDEIAKALGVNFVQGTNGADYYPGSSKSDVVEFWDGSDVGQLSPGIDDINGGGNPNQTRTNSYYGAFGQFAVTFFPQSEDLFILDSDVYLNNSDGTLSLTSGYQGQNNYFDLILGSPGSNVANKTTLRNVERLVLSDELQASTTGIRMLFDTIDDFGNRAPYLFLGGNHQNVYATELPKGILTGTQGPDYLQIPIGYNRTSPYLMGNGNDFVVLLTNGQPNGSGWQYTTGREANFTLTDDFFWKNPYAGDRSVLYGSSEGRKLYFDAVDLGEGVNEVRFANAPGDYLGIVSSAGVGGYNTISGDLGNTSHTLLITNLGGSVNLNFTPGSLQHGIYGIFSGANNNIALNGTAVRDLKNREYTFLLESQGLQHKFGVEELNEVEVEVTGSQILYRTVGSSTTLVDNLDADTPATKIVLASADLVGTSTAKQIGSDEQYSLEAPSRQTYIIGNSTAVFSKENGYLDDGIVVRGKVSGQDSAYRKVVLRNNINSRVTVGRGNDLFDEIVFEGNQPVNVPFLVDVESFKIGKVDFSQVNFDATTGKDFYSAFNRLLGDSYIHEVVYSNNSDILIDTSSSTLQVLSNQGQFTVSKLATDFQASPHTQYAPVYTHLLGDGDDKIFGYNDLYEFFYPGKGNNTVINTIPSGEFAVYDPSVDGRKFISTAEYNPDGSVSPSGPIFGDVVVYTEGSISDYVIQRSQTYQDAIEVTKKDGTKDLLFGVDIIKFETEDASLIQVPDTVKPSDPVSLSDSFGNDLKSKLFFSRTITSDGQSNDIKLDNEWAIDRVDLTQDIIRQPGKAPSSWRYDIPVGFQEFSLPKQWLLKEFQDADINVKGLYTLNDLTISDVKVMQGGQPVVVKAGQDIWQVKLSSPISLEGEPLEISYIIREPEGYLHLVKLTLNPSDIVDLKDLRIFRPNASANQFTGGALDDNVLGTELTDVIRGSLGKDAVYGEAGDDWIEGNEDADFISGDSGSDKIFGGGGDDFLDGDGLLTSSVTSTMDSNEAVTTNSTTSAADVIDGGEGNDIILGGAGNDILTPGTGTDLVDGGEGVDVGVSSGSRTEYRVRRRLDGSVVSIDLRPGIEGITLYRNVEQFQYSDQLVAVEQIAASSSGSVSISDDGTQALVTTSEANLQLKTSQGGKFLTVDTPSLEDLVIDKVLLAKSLAVLENYRNSKGGKFDARSSVLEFLTEYQQPASGDVIEVTLNQEQDVNTFIKVNPATGETFEFNYNAQTGVGAELIDANNNGLVDLVKIHLKDGEVGDVDGGVNSLIYDPGFLAKRLSGEGEMGVAPRRIRGGKQGINRKGTKRADTLVGTTRNDILKGLNSDDRLNGKNGNDRLDGGNGNDQIKSGKGHDEMLGGKGNDRLLGKAGNDVLIGGDGKDTLVGGAGIDLYRFTKLKEAGDQIRDFNSAEDLIDLRSIFAKPEFSGSIPFSRFNQFVQIAQVGTSTEVRVDRDGNGSGIVFQSLITLQNISVSAITSRNFVIS